jgi:hypothetical protein
MRLARQSLDLSQNATAGNSVLLTFSSTQSNGGLGQLAVGTFQLRAVPEPSTSAYLTGILSLAALLACRRKRHIALVTNPSQRALGRRKGILSYFNLISVRFYASRVHYSCEFPGGCSCVESRNLRRAGMEKDLLCDQTNS